MGIYKNTILTYSILIGPQALAQFHDLKIYSDQDWIHPLGHDHWLLHLPKHGSTFMWPLLETSHRYNNVVLKADFKLQPSFWKIDPFLLQTMNEIIHQIAPETEIKPVPQWWYYEGPMCCTYDFSDLSPRTNSSFSYHRWKVVNASPFPTIPQTHVTTSLCIIL